MAAPNAREIVEPPVTAAAYVAADERCLMEGRPIVRAAMLTDRAISVGVTQSLESPSLLRAKRLGIPIVRRSSGGLGVLHGAGDVLWSVILPRAHPLVGGDFTCAYPRLGAGVVDALAGVGVRSSWEEPFAWPATDYCLLGPRGKILAAGGRALGGAAQHLSGGALLHHGVIVARIDRPVLEEVFGIDPELASRHLTSLEEQGTSTDPRLIQSVVSALGRRVAETLDPTS